MITDSSSVTYLYQSSEEGRTILTVWYFASLTHHILLTYSSAVCALSVPEFNFTTDSIFTGYKKGNRTLF